jgi:hypothetical protein
VPPGKTIKACVSKHAYPTYGEAMKWLRRTVRARSAHYDSRLEPYRCPFCPFWHIGHVSKPIDRRRDYWNKRRQPLEMGDDND